MDHNSRALALNPYSDNLNAHDFSEFHMGYQLSNSSSSTGFDRNYNDGGSFSMAAAYLTRGSGPVYEWQAPYENNLISILMTHSHLRLE